MAKNQKFMKEISDQFLHCKICLEPFKNPKTLTCLHTFCFECLQQHLDAENSRSRFAIYNRNLVCPLCRKKTELPSGSIRRLPDNFLLSNLTEIVNRRRPSTIPPCEICPSGIRGNNASSKCLDCSKLLCKNCVGLHRNTKVTQDHTLIDIEGEKDIECKEHPEEIVRFYCDPCDTCICVVCTFQEHRDHEICSFTDGYIRYKESMENLLDKCKGRLEDVSNRIDMIDKCETSLRETRENIRDLAISYIQQVRQTEKELLRQVESHFSESASTFVNNREWLQENAEGLQSACNLAEIVMSERGVDMLLLKKEMEEKLTSLLDPNLPEVPPDFQPQMVKFVPGSVLFGSLKVNNNDSSDDLMNGSLERVNFGTQTDIVEDEPVIVTPIKPEMKEFSTQTRQKRTIQKEMNTDPISFDSDGQKSEPVKMTDSCVQAVTNAGSPSSGICVSCSEELKDAPTPVEFGEAPKIQGIVLMNSLDKDGKEWRRMRRSMIRSRRVQTDISLSNEDMAQRHGLVTNVAPVERSFSCDDVIDDRIVRSIGLDPIVIDPPEQSKPEQPRKRMRHKTTMTTCEMKPVVPMTDKYVSTLPSEQRTFSTQTMVQAKSIVTQTPTLQKSSRSTETDYAGQTDQSTGTPQVVCIDSETSMPVVTQVSTETWTDTAETTERAVCTEGCEKREMGTDMAHPINCDQGIQITPEVMDKNTNTGAENMRSQKSQTETVEDVSENRKSWHGGASFFSKLFKGKGSGSNTSLHDQTLSSTSSLQVCMVDSSTETNELILCDKETGTIHPVSTDQWTETLSPVMINTGISPPRPMYVDSSVETHQISTMDQATYTEVIQQKHVAVDTVIIVHDNETLTDKIRCQDAQTAVDLICDTNETNTESKILMDASVSTIDDWLRLSKPDSYDASTATPTPDRSTIGTNTNCMSLTEQYMTMENNGRLTPNTANRRDFGTMALSFGHSPSPMSDEMTQTFTVALYDKSVSTSREYIPDHERKIESCEMSTSTESLPYMGLLSELDGDELFLIPGSAFAKNPSIDSLTLYEDEIEMVDDETTMEELLQEDTSTQTFVPPAIFDVELFSDDDKFKMTREDKGNNLIDVGVNTLPKLTFEKETSTPIRHLFSKGTMTFYIAKTDKATSTFSSTRQIADSVFNQKPVHDKANKETMTVQHASKDVSTATESVATGGKMAECISKLRNVSDRLNSPTNKSSPEVPWQKSMSNDAIGCDNVDTGPSKKPEETKEGAKRKEKHTQRKTQPITSLKGKIGSTENNGSETNTKSLPRHGGTAVKMGSQSSAANRKATPRYNSAPGKIATSPNQIGRKQTAQPAASQSKLPVVDNTDRPKTPINKRKSKSPMPPTPTSSRRSSNASDVSVSSSGPNKTPDLNSLRVPSPISASGKSSPKRPSSPAGPRDKTPDGRKNSSNVGFMQKLFSKKKKQEEEKTTPESPKKPRKKFTLPPPPPPEPPKPPKPQKSKAFVYMRQRIFSIEHDNEKPSRRGSKDDDGEGRRDSSGSGSSHQSGNIEDRPSSTYDNL